MGLKSQIKNTLLNFLKGDFTEDQSVLVYINSHGGEKGQIASFDTTYNRYEVIIEPFRNNQKYYPTLVGKPKIFVFDACRGGRSMNGQYIALKRNQGPAPCSCKKVSYTERKINLNTWPKTNLNAEFLILSSQCERYFSKEAGLIPTLCAILKSSNEDFLSIVTDVSKELFEGRGKTTRSQMPEIKCTLSTKLYFGSRRCKPNK